MIKRLKNIEILKSSKTSNPHVDHYVCLKEKYRREGVDSLQFHELLELLLFYFLPIGKSNRIAHKLKEKFHDSFAELFESSDKKLKETAGMTDNIVFLFKLLTDITRRYNIERANKSHAVENIKAHEDFLTAYFTGKQEEEMILLSLNNRRKRISTDVIYAGCSDFTKTDMNKAVRIALKNNAKGIIVAHNYPNGFVYPPKQDMETTRRLARVFNEISINFIEYYIISGTEIFGIKEKSIFSSI